jgi:hypothetical protein
LHPVKAARREIEAKVWAMIHDHPTLKASLSRANGAYQFATFKKLEGRPNWTMEWTTDARRAKDAYEWIVRSVQPRLSWKRRPTVLRVPTRVAIYSGARPAGGI